MVNEAGHPYVMDFGLADAGFGRSTTTANLNVIADYNLVEFGTNPQPVGFVHRGGNNPESEGWTKLRSGTDRTDSGYDGRYHWEIDASGSDTSYLGYRIDQNDAGFLDVLNNPGGWQMTATVKVVVGMDDVNAPFFGVRDGQDWWQLSLLGAAGGATDGVYYQDESGTSVLLHAGYGLTRKGNEIELGPSEAVAASPRIPGRSATRRRCRMPSWSFAASPPGPMPSTAGASPTAGTSTASSRWSKLGTVNTTSCARNSRRPNDNVYSSVYHNYDFPCPKPGAQVILGTPFGTGWSRRASRRLFDRRRGWEAADRGGLGCAGSPVGRHRAASRRAPARRLLAARVPPSRHDLAGRTGQPDGGRPALRHRLRASAGSSGRCCPRPRKTPATCTACPGPCIRWPTSRFAAAGWHTRTSPGSRTWGSRARWPSRSGCTTGTQATRRICATWLTLSCSRGARFLLAYLSKEADGRLHLVPTVSPEHWGLTARFERNRDGASALTLTRYLLRAAAAAAGEIRDVQIHSTLGGQCRLADPWPGRAVEGTSADGTTVKTFHAGQTELAFPTQPGGSYRLRPLP